MLGSLYTRFKILHQIVKLLQVKIGWKLRRGGGGDAEPEGKMRPKENRVKKF